METLSFDAAMRMLIDDARWNFTHFRGTLHEPASPVVAIYDGTFAVEGACSAYVHLLDYDVPLARIEIYEGDDDAAAELVFSVYCERLLTFAAGPGTRSDFTQTFGGRSVHWTTMSYPTEGPPISVYRVESDPPREDEDDFAVWVEVRGLAVECIEGSPDDSPWRIMLGDA